MTDRSPSVQKQLDRALNYPYERPNSSFLFISGEVYTFANASWRGLGDLGSLPVKDEHGECLTGYEAAQSQGIIPSRLDADGDAAYTAILAIGSNAGPEQLRRKFPADMFPGGFVIPVIQCVLQDFDVVYTPYICSYGSCTATLEHSPGTSIGIFVTYLTKPLAQRMHVTEGGYNLCNLRGLTLQLAAALPSPTDGRQCDASATVSSSHQLTSVVQYNHQKGTLLLPDVAQDGQRTPIAIAAIPATGRRFPAVSQAHMLSLLRGVLAADKTDGAWPPPVDFQVPQEEGGPSVSAPPAGARVASWTALEDWVLEAIGSAHGRFSRRLERSAQPFQYPHSDVLQEI